MAQYTIGNRLNCKWISNVGAYQKNIA